MLPAEQSKRASGYSLVEHVDDHVAGLANLDRCFAEQTDLLNMAGDANLDLSAVLVASGDRADAEISIERALGLFRREGNLASAARAKVMLERTATSPLATS